MCCIFSKPQDWILMFISFVSDSFSELEWTNYQCDEEGFPPFLSNNVWYYKDSLNIITSNSADFCQAQGQG